MAWASATEGDVLAVAATLPLDLVGAAYAVRPYLLIQWTGLLFCDAITGIGTWMQTLTADEHTQQGTEVRVVRTTAIQSGILALTTALTTQRLKPTVALWRRYLRQRACRIHDKLLMMLCRIRDKLLIMLCRIRDKFVMMLVIMMSLW